MSSAALIILRRELKVFFLSPLFYLIAFLSTILMSVTFAMGLNNFAQMQTNSIFQMQAEPQFLNIHYSVFLQHLSILNLLFIFFIPALSMRLLAEEKKNKTFDLLMTSPIESQDIVVGKFLSLMAVVIALSFIALMYIVISRNFFEFTYTTTLVAFAGMILVAAVYSSVCLFASSLTDNSLVAFILGIVFNISIWIFGGMGDIFDSPLAKSIFDQVSLNNHLQSMIEGAVKTNALVFFFSIIFLFSFLTERMIESNRWRSI
jgi:ABC-2 type transport system permease protein